MYLLIGQTIHNYTITEKIGGGSYSTVYKADHPSFNHPVVLKALHLRHMKSQEMRYRFQLEAEALYRLNHPNIVPIYDYWQEEDGAFLVLKWLDGGSLRDKINFGMHFSLEQIAYILDQISAGLDVAHALGIIHRDIKPDNVLFDRRGQVYLTDFGIAKHVSKDSTLFKVAMGTPGYIAPEQIVSKFATPQSDLYSVGIMLYEMIVGTRPFVDENPSKVLLKHMNERVPMITLDEAYAQQPMNALIQRATAKAPHERYDDVKSLAKAFRSILETKQRQYALSS